MQKQKEITVKINHFLKDFFTKKKKEGPKQGPYYRELIEQIESITLRGGDKMRPLLVYYSYTAVKNNLSDEEENQLLAISLCTELFHTACLIHDDVMDQSLTRRGGLTIHQYFSQKYKNEKLGRDLAILAGDLALIWADEIFHQNAKFFARAENLATKYFNLLREEVIVGQQLDLMLSSGAVIPTTSTLLSINFVEESSKCVLFATDPSTPSLAGLGTTQKNKAVDNEIKLILKMYEYKTAKYSFERPIHLGLALAGAKEKDFQTFSKFALAVGVAFQIHDDLLGSFGDEKKTGKSTEDDIRENKKTLLMTLTKCKMQNAKIKNNFTKILNKKSLDESDIKIIKEFIVSSGALEKCQTKARSLVEEGKKALQGCKINQETKDFFLKLADYAVEREE